jgi:non-specific serine/threonine protein kinase
VQDVESQADAMPTPGVAELLRAYRLSAMLTQGALAERAGLSVRAISDLERGIRRFPHPNTVRRVVHALGLAEPDRVLIEKAATRVDSAAFSSPLQTSTGAVAILHNLPLQLTSFVGRAQETADICHQLERSRLLTLAGPGGVSKTRLALQVAEEKLKKPEKLEKLEISSFRDGVWFVELAPLIEPALVPHTVANVFDVREKPDESLLTSLVSTLQPLHILLILDNCEHLLPACVELVDRLLRACPGVVVLTTSREALGLGAETVWRVPPLRVNTHDIVDGHAPGAAGEAVELFVERARAIERGFAISPHNVLALLEICERLEGLPLGIELAASRVGVFGPEQLAKRLAADAGLLISKDRTATRRQQTLENAIQWSYDLLTSDERSLFDRLSVFAGGWTLEAMEVVAGEDSPGRGWPIVLERLVDKSLVQVDDTAGGCRRYRLLEPLRQFARTRLERRGEVASAYERHAAFFLDLFEQAEQEFLTQFATAGLVRRMDTELGNLRVALRWLIAQSDVGRAQRLAGASRTLWLQQGYLAEYRRWTDEALALDPATGPWKEPQARARALLGLLGTALYQGDLAVAEDAGRGCLHLFEEHHDTARASGALRFLGLLAIARGDLVGARPIMERALIASQQTNQLGPCAVSLCQIAELDLEEGDLEAARRHSDEALKLAIAAAHATSRIWALVNLGEVHRRRRRPDAAKRLWEEALILVRGEPRQHSYIHPLMTVGALDVRPVPARPGPAATRAPHTPPTSATPLKPTPQRRG